MWNPFKKTKGYTFTDEDRQLADKKKELNRERKRIELEKTEREIKSLRGVNIEEKETIQTGEKNSLSEIDKQLELNKKVKQYCKEILKIDLDDLPDVDDDSDPVEKMLLSVVMENMKSKAVTPTTIPNLEQQANPIQPQTEIKKPQSSSDDNEDEDVLTEKETYLIDVYRRCPPEWQRKLDGFLPAIEKKLNSIENKQ